MPTARSASARWSASPCRGRAVADHRSRVGGARSRRAWAPARWRPRSPGCLGLDAADRRAVFQAALLRAVGCTALRVGERRAVRRRRRVPGRAQGLRPGRSGRVRAPSWREFGTLGRPGRSRRLAQRFVDGRATEGGRATGSGCEVSRALGPRLGLAPAAVEALDDVYERWDGLGLPAGAAGRAALAGRADRARGRAGGAGAHAGGGPRGRAWRRSRRRAGGHLDPDLARWLRRRRRRGAGGAGRSRPAGRGGGGRAGAGGAGRPGRA